MAHNYYLEEAKKKTQDKDMKLKPSVMHTTSLQNTTNGSKPKHRNNNQTSRSLPISKSYGGMSNVPEVIAPEPAISTGTPSSTTIDQDAPSIKPSSEESSTQFVIPNNVHSINQPPKHINKWTKDHPIDNVIGDPSRPVSTRHQLQDESLLCYFDAFLSFIEPKSYKEALTGSSWIEAMQEELNEFERLKVWELVPRSDHVMIIPLQWIYKVKLDELGGVLKNKAR
nr:hypothetical protein [Tanacetum cinerariifolium]